MYILTLIASNRLGESDVSRALDRMALGHELIVKVEWLERGSACDIYFEGDPGRVRPFLEGYLGDVDFVMQYEPLRQRQLLVADMDSTMITVECIDELADFAGLKPQVAAITERAMQGELDFEAALDARVALLEGMDAEVIDQCRKDRVRPTPGARELVRTMKAKGATCLLVSGGFTRFAEPVADMIGFDRAVANVLIIEDGKLTGSVQKPVVGAETKKQVLLEAMSELGLSRKDTVGVGDGANDVPMLLEVGLSVGYRAKAAVRGFANLALDNNDLSAVLYAQGIPSSQWVTD